MRYLITAVLLSTACLAFAGCGTDEDLSSPSVHGKYGDANWYRENKPGQIWLHRKDCKVWNNDWEAVPDAQAGYWVDLDTVEAAKPESEWNHDKVMRNHDGRRIIIYCQNCPL